MCGKRSKRVATGEWAKRKRNYGRTRVGEAGEKGAKNYVLRLQGGAEGAPTRAAGKKKSPRRVPIPISRGKEGSGRGGGKGTDKCGEGKKT